MKIIGKIHHLVLWIGITAYLVLTLGRLPGMAVCPEQNSLIQLKMGAHEDYHEIYKDLIRKNLKAHLTLPQSVLQATDYKRYTHQPFNRTIMARHRSVVQKLVSLSLNMSTFKTRYTTIGYLASITHHLLPQPPPRIPEIHRFLSPVILII